MAVSRWALGGMVCLSTVTLTGCASLEELRQAQMDNRNMIAEKAQLEQELYDLRTATQSLRGRSDSLEDQLATKDQLVANLQEENDNLETNFRKAQGLLEKFADRPLGKPVLAAAALPPELDMALQEFAAQYPQSVTYDSEHGAVKWTSDLLFALGSDVVKDTALSSLRRFGEIMGSPAAEGFDVIVAGHTDDVRISRAQTRQKHPTNWHLSVHRAISVADRLQKENLAPTRIGVMGFGQFKPLAANDSDVNRRRNRRVEMYVVPSGTFSAGVAVGQKVMSFTGSDPKETTK